MSFKNYNISLRYRSDVNDMPKDVLIPILRETVTYKRAVGFFSTSALVTLSVGLFDMAQRGGQVKVICSPKLSDEDIKAIEFGYETREKVLERALVINLTSPINEFQEERLNLVATMVASGMMEFKVAFVENFTGKNMYHEKYAVFIDDEGNRICHTGGVNESENAYNENFDSLFMFCSWKDDSQQEGARLIEEDFDRLWENNTEKLSVIPFPKIAIDKLLQYKRDVVDWKTDEKEFLVSEILKTEPKFHIPANVRLREYQEKAIAKWFEQNCSGIFSMCTGAGKTYTALACMVELAETLEEKLAVFIVCPYIHLVGQWEEDVVEWGITPIIAHSKSPQKDWESRIRRAVRRFVTDGTPFICITTNDTFQGDKLHPFVERIPDGSNTLLIIDEAHNFGAERLSLSLPDHFKFRIALSATIRRHMDKSGTARLFDYFGDECITYGLEQAIDEGALVHYEYYPIPVYLDEDEQEEFVALSNELKRYLISENGKLKLSEAAKPVIYKRTRLLAKARQKIDLLMSLIEPYRTDNNILVYCGATKNEDDSGEIRQIDLVTNKLRSEYGMSVQRFTAEENLIERQKIKHYFSEGVYQAITAIKCLDEGVNIPGIKLAFILSSSRNPKEFIQRRGRLLRTAPGKEKAYIYDFVTLPRDLDDVYPGDYDSDRTVVLGEMARINEFGKLADNKATAHILMNRIMDSYGIDIDIEEEMEKMEDYYG